MSTRFLIAIALTLWSAGTFLLPGKASATTPLTNAKVETIRKLVEVNLKNQGFRQAKAKQDTLIPRDALKTGQASMAELRFNDRSLARIGEKALFEFQPGSREIRLDRGTVLLLIQPKQGQTRVRTPNAAAGIRGSALFVRYIPDDNPNDDLGPITIVGALTNSDITVSNQDESQKYVLKAGQLAVVHRNTIGLYTFDLNSFYATSPLAQGLDLNQSAGSKSNLDPTIADVRTETLEALKTASSKNAVPFQKLAANPAWMLMSPTATQASQSTSTTSTSSNPLPNVLGRETVGFSSITNAAEVLNGIREGMPRVPGSTFNPPGSVITASPPPASAVITVVAPPAATTAPPTLQPAAGPAAGISPEPSTRPTPQTPPTPSPISPPAVTPPATPTPVNPPATPITPPVVVAPPPVSAAPTPPVVVTPPVTTPPVVVTPPVTTPPVEPPVVPAPAPAPIRPTPAIPAIPAVPNPGNGPATPAVPAVPAAPAANVNLTVSPPALDASPIQPAAAPAAVNATVTLPTTTGTVTTTP